MRVLESPSKTPAEYAQAPSHANVLGVINADDPRLQLTQRIAASGSLGRSRLLVRFLQYVVERHVSNRSDEITEQQIGVHVFGRPGDYDPGEDNIVRSYARTLRDRIQKYFETEGLEEELLLEIPRGGYEPFFTSRSKALEAVLDGVIASSEPNLLVVSEDSEEPNVQETPVPAGSTASGRGNFLNGLEKFFNFKQLLTLGIGGIFGIGLTLLILRGNLLLSPDQEATRVLWRQLFNKDRDTFVVPSDNGLVILQGLIPSPLPLNSYVDGSYRAKIQSDDSWGVKRLLILASKRYTNVTDLDFVAHLAQFNDVVPEHMMIRFARDLRMDDLRSSNAILLGSIQSNPWVQLFQPQMHFRFRFDRNIDKELVITNESPRPGEAPLYTHLGDQHTYGVIAYLPNLNATDHVLIVAGVNMAGTQAAGAVLLNPSLIAPTLERARTSHGDLQQFELLIESDNVATNASIPHIVAERIGPVSQSSEGR